MLPAQSFTDAVMYQAIILLNHVDKLMGKEVS